MKTHTTTPPPQKKLQKKARGATAKSVAVAACTALAGCTGAQAVRPLPPPEECPPEALEAMRQLGFGNPRDIAAVDLLPAHRTFENAHVTQVQPGQVTVHVLDKMGKLKEGFWVSGQLIVGEGRLYGRFTEMRTKDNKVYPVCLELLGAVRNSQAPRGLELEPGSTPEAPRVYSTGNIRAVKRFE